MRIDTTKIHLMPDSETDCQRCGVPMKNAGEVALPDRPLGAAEASGSGQSWLQCEVYICASCGKAEFFV